MSSAYALKVKDLQTHFMLRAGIARAVDIVSFAVKRGEIMGLVGESGSGKSVLGYSIMGLVDPPGKIVGGEIEFNGRNLITLPKSEWREIRGHKIAMIFQDPMMTLNPVLRIDTQMIETILAHRMMPRAEARTIARDALGRVGIPSPDERLASYPHQFSGGMRQRVAIAIALLNRPELVIADEPTTALDVTIQGQILYETSKLCKETGTSMIWITHDLGVVAGLVHSISVMYAGKILEQGEINEVLDNPVHPYTVGLLNSIPGHNTRGSRLFQIPGMTPSLLNLPQGCAFASRCPYSDQACTKQPKLQARNNQHRFRCFHPVQHRCV